MMFQMFCSRIGMTICWFLEELLGDCWMEFRDLVLAGCLVSGGEAQCWNFHDTLEFPD